MDNMELERLRRQIKENDAEMVRLLNERASVAIEIGREKNAHGRDIYDVSQEGNVFKHLADVNNGPLTEAALTAIFREIISACRALQSRLTVCYFGPEASFTHMAALSHFGTQVDMRPSPSISGVFETVEREAAQLGIVPIENSTEGSVKLTLDKLITTPLRVQAEVFLRIRHCLLSNLPDFASIRTVYSHPQAIAQCQGWLKNHLPNAAVIEAENTAGAALRVCQDPEAAAIGSRVAAETYGLNILAEGIEDHPINTTRFFVIGSGESKPTGADKTSVLFGTAHAPGSLYRALTPFAERGVNLTRIESYPVKDRMWEYLFFVDCLGHSDDADVRDCLGDLKRRAAFVKILGSYPQGREWT
jgi:chorismate mutase/prephenate dehydratase